MLAESADATVTYDNIVDAITARNAHKENYPDIVNEYIKSEPL